MSFPPPPPPPPGAGRYTSHGMGVPSHPSSYLNANNEKKHEEQRGIHPHAYPQPPAPMAGSAPRYSYGAAPPPPGQPPPMPPPHQGNRFHPPPPMPGHHLPPPPPGPPPPHPHPHPPPPHPHPPPPRPPHPMHPHSHSQSHPQSYPPPHPGIHPPPPPMHQGPPSGHAPPHPAMPPPPMQYQTPAAPPLPPDQRQPPLPNPTQRRAPPPSSSYQPPQLSEPQFLLPGQTLTQQQPTRKIDPSQIPRPPLFTRPQDYQAVPIYYPKQSLFADLRPPPAADSRFLTQDDGNAAPQLMRSTLYSMPIDRGLRRQTGNLPMALLCTPLAVHSADSSPRPRLLPDGTTLEEWQDPMRIPVAPTPPPRCRQCNAYTSSFWTTQCNFCQASGAPPGPCSTGTVEYVVDGPYITRPTPVAPHYVYAVDATCPNLKDYIDLIATVGRSITTDAARIGVVLVSCFGIYLPQFKPDGSMGFAVMSDVTEQPYCPLPISEWTFSPRSDAWNKFTSELWGAWKPLVKQLSKKNPYGHMGYAQSCGGAALTFLSDALAANGGRGTWISWRRPNFGVGMLRDRERNQLALYKKEGTEKTLYLGLQKQANVVDDMDQRASECYKKIASECAKNRVAIDVILHTTPKPMAFLDLATLTEVCRITCGKLTWVRSPDWKEQLQNELLRPVLSFYGTDAIFKVRCSNGLQVKSYTTVPGVTIENSLVGSPELELSVVDQATCIAVELEHRVGGLSKKENACYVQSALLYTTISGQRRVRVSTLALKVGTIAADVYRGVDFGALTALFTRQAIGRLWDSRKQSEEQPLEEARMDLTETVTKALAGYRLHTNAKTLPQGQLILPDRLQLLPLFCMALLKSNMLRPSLPKRGSGLRTDHASPSGDERAYALFHGSAVTPAMAMVMVHPNIFSVSSLADGAGEWQLPQFEGAQPTELAIAAHHAYIQLPRSVHPSITCIEDDQVYLVDDGMCIYLFIGQDVPQDVRSELIEAHSDYDTLSTSSDFGQQVQRLVWQLRTYSSVGPGAETMTRPSFPPLIVVKGHPSHRDPFEEKVMHLMVDDQLGGEPDYSAFLVESHKLVKAMVSRGSVD